jgi:benzodiazapine receptor
MNEDKAGMAGAALTAAGAVLGAAIIGGRSGPQQPRAGWWYARLRKPAFTPPGPVFGAAWSVLYCLIGFAGYRLLRAPPSSRRTTALSGWSGTVAGIALFPWTFFGRRDLVTSGVVTTGMLAASATTVVAATGVDQAAARAMSPAVAWVTFALLLNEELWRRNG